MASISASIELYDRMSAPLYSMMNAMNMAISSMRDMQSTMGSDVDTSSLDAATQAANQAQAAMEALNQSMHTGSSTPTQPAQVPVEWVTPENMDIFTNSGIDRFQQEVTAANQMLTTLSDKQSQIAQNAAGTDIFSDSALQDINSMGQRIQAVQQRIQQIENNPVNLGTDNANAALEQLRSQLNQALQAQEALNQAVDNMDVSAANAAYNQLSSTVANTERYIRDNADAQGNLNQQIQAGVNTSNELVNTVKRLAAAYLSIQTVQKVINVSDELAMATARLNNMNQAFNKINGTATETDTIVKQIYASAQNARGSFGDMAAIAAKFGNNARNAFANQDEVIAFTNLIQKQMTIAGASTQEASNATLQLSQALGSGVLRGDELNSVFEQAPNLIQYIADYLDVPIGKIREMAQDGQLTADVVKTAIFSAADDINTKFSQMPMTWGQVWTSFQNSALMAFQPVLDKVNELANNDQFQGFVENAVSALATVAVFALDIMNTMSELGGFIADNWSVIEPIVLGAATAMGIYTAALLIGKGIMLAMAVAQAIHTVMTSAWSIATFTATVAQYGLNAALMACPLTWIIILIIAVIAIIVALCNWIANVTGIAQTGIGVITGALAVAAAVILNNLIDLANFIINIGINLWNLIANFAAAFGVIFNDPVAAIKAEILSMFNFIVGVVGKAAAILDAVFGSNLASAVSGFRDNIQAEINSTIEGAGGTAAKTLNASDYTLDRINYGDAFNAGASWGDGIVSKVSGLFSMDNIDLTGGVDTSMLPSDFANNAAQTAANTADTADSAGKIADSVDISNENLKYLRDIAETEAINRFTTAEIQVTMNNNNTISGDMDIDGMVDILSAGVLEAMERAAEGVH